MPQLNNQPLQVSNCFFAFEYNVCVCQTTENVLCADNVAPLVHEGVVEPPAGVTAPVPSHLNNATGQNATPPVPQIPFPVFSDPFQHELEKLRRESEKTKKTYEENVSCSQYQLYLVLVLFISMFN